MRNVAIIRKIHINVAECERQGGKERKDMREGGARKQAKLLLI